MGRFPGPGLGEIEEADMAALARQPEGDRPADAGGAAGDDGDTIGQTVHSSSLPEAQ
jgi:hypothetical protein